jgi:uncharacterized Zn finger protein (UPF0148 family)
MGILPDEDGYLDKECPNQDCQSKYKVNSEDWKAIFSDENVYCPFCGHSDPANKWYTTEQIEQAKQQAVDNIKAQLGQALKKDASNFNRTAPKGFISMSMKFSGTTYAANLPAEAMEEMQQKITCEKCGARYAVIGSAFYCPCCGHNSAKLTFNNTLEKVKSKINNLDTIRKAIAEHSKDEAERTYASLLESSIPDLVVAIQRLCECIYVQLPNTKMPKKNVFQRIDDGNALWKDVCGKGYDDWLSCDEINHLKKCFQQRHLLQHQEGIVDVEYINKSGDTSYRIGQRLIIKEKDVLCYTQIAEKLGQRIIALLDDKTEEE